MTHAPSELPQKPARGRLTHQGEAERLPPLQPGLCDYCKKATGARTKRFCGSRCRTRWWSMARNRGAQLYQLLLIWRFYRGRKGTPGAGMFTRIGKMVDDWRKMDRTNAD